MFPENRFINPYHKQRGFLIPLALFILVGMLALALAVSRLTGQSGISATLEMLSTQAFYAAESGGQYAMHQLSFNSTCAATTTLNFPAPGLQACQAEVSCLQTPGTDFYAITSAANCGTGELSAQRTIQISAFMP